MMNTADVIEFCECVERGNEHMRREFADHEARESVTMPNANLQAMLQTSDAACHIIRMLVAERE